MKILFLFLIFNLINFIFSTQATELIEMDSSAYNGDTTNQKKNNIITFFTKIIFIKYKLFKNFF